MVRLRALRLEPVSLFGPKLRFFAPAHLLVGRSRAGAVKAGRCATVPHSSTACRPRLDCPEHGCTLAKAARDIAHCSGLSACSVLRPSHVSDRLRSIAATWCSGRGRHTHVPRRRRRLGREGRVARSIAPGRGHLRPRAARLPLEAHSRCNALLPALLQGVSCASLISTNSNT